MAGSSLFYLITKQKMGIVKRGVKNAFRNSIRTISIIAILSLSIGMALVMFLAVRAVETKIENVKSLVGTTITITPAGARGFEGGGEALTNTEIKAIASLEHVAKTVNLINDRLQAESDINLKSAIDMGSLGERQTRGLGDQGGGTPPEGLTNTSGEMKMPITITGINDLTSTEALQVSELKITSGNTFDATGTERVALVGSELATQNDLKVGSKFKAYGKKISVVGIFDGGNKFMNSGIIMPLATLQKLSDQKNQLTQVVVQTDSIDSIDSVLSAVQNKLGDKADVVSQKASAEETLKPLENIKTISIYSLIGALVAGSVIIFLTMIMIVRERRREIGVLKAIGASNVNITTQFVIESLVLTLCGAIAGTIAGVFASNPVLKLLVSSSTSTTTIGGGMRPGAIMQAGLGFMGNTVRDVAAIVNFDIILYGLLAAIVIAVLGSAIPAFFIAKIRPAEVMRSE